MPVRVLHLVDYEIFTVYKLELWKQFSVSPFYMNLDELVELKD